MRGKPLTVYKVISFIVAWGLWVFPGLLITGFYLLAIFIDPGIALRSVTGFELTPFFLALVPLGNLLLIKWPRIGYATMACGVAGVPITCIAVANSPQWHNVGLHTPLVLFPSILACVAILGFTLCAITAPHLRTTRTSPEVKVVSS